VRVRNRLPFKTSLTFRNRDIISILTSLTRASQNWHYVMRRARLAEFFSPNLSRASRQICWLAANFGATKKQLFILLLGHTEIRS
jgi:hypothetical protein